MSVRVSIEPARGCGYRKPGGLYLVSGQLSEPCPLLPYETHVCPTCGEGIKPARGFTWVDGASFIPPQEHGSSDHTMVCPLAPAGWEDGGPISRLGRCGLIWVGEQHYKTPQAFMEEAHRMGVSRRIKAVPKDFEVGTTWVLLGHRKAITRACSEGCGDEAQPDPDCPVCAGSGWEHRPGVITAFLPVAVEYVITGEETEEELEALEARGLSLVQVIQEEAQEVLL